MQICAKMHLTLNQWQTYCSGQKWLKIHQISRECDLFETHSISRPMTLSKGCKVKMHISHNKTFWIVLILHSVITHRSNRRWVGLFWSSGLILRLSLKPLSQDTFFPSALHDVIALYGGSSLFGGEGGLLLLGPTRKRDSISNFHSCKEFIVNESSFHYSCCVENLNLKI